jgi:hypothetical protein
MSGSNGKRYVKVGPTDVAFAGKRTSLLIGPVQHLGAERTLASFQRLAQRGPSARVGLQPSSATDKWLFDPDRCGVVTTVPAVDLDEMLSDFEAFVARASVQDEPLVATFCGDYVMLSFDHGIGDATACLELTAVATGADITDYLRPTVRRPLSRAVSRTLKSSPRSVVDGLSGSPKPPAGLTRQYPPADVQNIVMTYVRTGPEFLTTIKALRKQFFPETSVTAAVTYALRSAFEAHGRQTTDDLSVLVDLRRYLGEGETTLANLSAVADLTAPPDISVNDFGAEFASALKGAAPLVRLAGSVAKRRARGWPGDGPQGSQWPAKTRLTFSDPTKHPAMKKMKWLDNTDQPLAYVLINDPTLPHQITITAMCDHQMRFHFTASYFSGSYQRTEIDRIITAVAENPASYLGSTVLSGAG